MTIWVVHTLQKRGIDVSNVQINMDWQHLLMNGEHLAEYAALLAREGLLGHQHGNSGWGQFDDDNIVGAEWFMSTLELAYTLQKVGYGQKGERVGFDLFPYTEDPVEATRQSVLQWEFIWHLASKIDQKKLAQAQAANDALGAYKAVYEVLGLDQAFVEQVVASRKRK